MAGKPHQALYVEMIWVGVGDEHEVRPQLRCTQSAARHGFECAPVVRGPGQWLEEQADIAGFREPPGMSEMRPMRGLGP